MPGRRRRRGREGLKADPNLTPLLDVVLQLITFFLMLIHFGTRIEGATRGIRLPTGPPALPGTRCAWIGSSWRRRGRADSGPGARCRRRRGRTLVGRPGRA